MPDGFGQGPQAPSQPTPMPRKLVKRRVRAESKKIGCPQCAAPIEVRNYAMAEQVTCSYCGAVLDLAGEEKKVVRQVLLDQRPPAVLDLGKKGRVKGTVYEVIGRIRLKGYEDGETFYWDEYLLFNPQKGYAWLQEDEGRWTFFIKMRNKPTFDPKSARKGQRFVASGQTYVVNEVSEATVDFVEGEFTYHVQVGDRVGNLDARSPCGRYECSSEWTANELEWLIGNRIASTSIGQAFSVKVPPEKPYYEDDDDDDSDDDYEYSVGNDFYGFGVTGWAVMFGMLFGMLSFMSYTVFSGDLATRCNVRAEQYLVGGRGYVSEAFKVEAPTVVEVIYSANVSNSWVFVETELLDAQKDTVHVWGNNISYYSGYEGGEHWSEGSRSSSTVFKLRKSGTYYLSISSGEGGSGNYGSTPRREDVKVTVKTGVVVVRYFLILFGVCVGIVFLILYLSGQFDDD